MSGHYILGLYYYTYKTTEYPGLNKLPDGTFVATNSVAYREGENYSIVSTQFRLDDMDSKLLKTNNKIQSPSPVLFPIVTLILLSGFP